MSYDTCEKCGKRGGPASGYAVIPCGAEDCPRKPPKFFTDMIESMPVTETHPWGIVRESTPPPASQPAKQGEWECERCDGDGTIVCDGDNSLHPCPVCATHPAQATIKDDPLEALCEKRFNEIAELSGKVAALTAEIARLREDAGRYRYGVEHGFPTLHNQIHPEIKRLGWTYNEFEPDAAYYETADEAIDTAIRASRGEGL